MSNKANYDVNFQYDFDEDDTKKFSDGRIKRVMLAHEGEFVSDFADYGIKDMTFNIKATPETLKSIMDTVLKDAERTNVRMTVFVKKKFDLVLFNTSDVENKEALFEQLEEKKSEFSFKKINVSVHDSNEISLELNSNTDTKQVLSLIQPFLESLKAKNVAIDSDSVEFMQMDNYKNRSKKSFDY